MLLRNFPILLLLLLSFYSNGQNKTQSDFESTKGQWDFPISNVQEIDTAASDCYHIYRDVFSLTLKTNNPTPVKAIQPGLVQAVIDLGKYCVIEIKSGDYFLFYSGLSNPKVKKGNVVMKGSEIGDLAKDDSDDYKYFLDLILLKGRDFININRWFNWKAE